MGKRTPLAAIDSTGLETRHVSACYTQRCQRHQGHYKSRYPKLSAVGDTANHLILGCVVDRGPKLDIMEAQATVRETVSPQPLGALLGDPGYEAEGFHRLCREELHLRSIIPTTDRGRPRADGQPHAVRGHYRRLMKSHFPKVLYGQRWQAETTISMLKRNFGSALRARSYHSQNREIRLRILTHDLGILLRPLRHVMSHQVTACSIQSRTHPIIALLCRIYRLPFRFPPPFHSDPLHQTRPAYQNRQPFRRSFVKMLLWGQLSRKGAKETRGKSRYSVATRTAGHVFVIHCSAAGSDVTRRRAGTA